MLANGQFTKSNASEAVKERWIARTDSLQAFATNFIELNSGCFTTKDALYAAYQEYCEEHTLAAVEKQAVGKRLPTLVPTVGYKPQVEGKRVTAWKDISIAGVSERRDNEDAGATTPDLGSFSSHVTDVKEDSSSTRRSEKSSAVVSTNNECENKPDMCDATIDFVAAAIKERLHLKKNNGFRVSNVDELMVDVVKDIHLDYFDLDPADIAATFREVQQSDEGVG